MGIFSSKSAGKSKNKPSMIENFKYPITLQKRLENLKEDQKDFLKFNIGGEIYQISKNLIEECPYDNYFKKQLIFLEENEEIFLDRSSTDFDLIIHILRTSFFIKKIGDNFAPCKFFEIKKLIKDKEIFRDDLKFYFGKDFDNIIKDYDLTVKLDLNDINSYITSYELIRPDKDERIDFMFYRAKEVKELFNLYSRKGFFCLHGGGIVLNLSNYKSVKRLEFRPFIFDNLFFKEEDLPTVNISIKNYRDEWHSIGNFNMIYDEDKIMNVYIECSCRAIKISADTDEGEFPFSISYIKIY
jgi:hypothetical protein